MVLINALKISTEFCILANRCQFLPLTAWANRAERGRCVQPPSGRQLTRYTAESEDRSWLLLLLPPSENVPACSHYTPSPSAATRIQPKQPARNNWRPTFTFNSVRLGQKIHTTGSPLCWFFSLWFNKAHLPHRCQRFMFKIALLYIYTPLIPQFLLFFNLNCLNLLLLLLFLKWKLKSFCIFWKTLLDCTCQNRWTN